MGYGSYSYELLRPSYELRQLVARATDYDFCERPSYSYECLSPCMHTCTRQIFSPAAPQSTQGPAAETKECDFR